ncbi:MAG TPA: MBL fold metallo-hydrolase, partial [Burkholderiaceae bacterium]|nr:MBL fold metallo-hydrolase [Burkholderiaceae bacterium]
ALVTLLTATALIGSAIASDGLPPMVIEKVGQDVYVVRGQAGQASAANAGFISNAGAVATGEGLVVFDTLGTPALGAKMRKLLEDASGEKVKLVVVSHYHADHFYGIQAFQGPGVEIIAHPKAEQVFKDANTQNRLAQRQQDLFPWVSEDTRLVLAARKAKVAPGQNETFQLGRHRFTLIDGLGAHAPDDLMMRVDNLGVVFAGDLFFTGRVPFVGSANPRVWLAALDRMAEQPPKVAIPGHGAISHQPQKDLDLTRRYLDFLSKQMAQAVANLQSFEEAYDSIDWSAFKELPAFSAANRLNAHGAYLHAEQDALKK